MSYTSYSKFAPISYIGEGFCVSQAYPVKQRGFEKVSFEQYVQSRKENTEEQSALEYLNIKAPQRSTKKSAGYDFFAPFDFVLKAGQTIKIPTGIKAYMCDNEVLLMHVRSSLGFKFDVVLANSTGIVDSDYYGNASNEGHIFVKLINHGENHLEVHKGEAICQGIFQEYLKVDNDSPKSEERTGGIGSTNEK